MDVKTERDSTMRTQELIQQRRNLFTALNIRTYRIKDTEHRGAKATEHTFIQLQQANSKT